MFCKGRTTLRWRTICSQLCLPISLSIAKGHTRAAGFAHQHRFGQHLGRGVGNVRTGLDDLPGNKFQLARRPSDLGDATVRLDEVTSINGSEELYVIIGAEKALVAIETNAEFSSHVAEKL